MSEFALPSPRPQQFGVDAVNLRRKNRPQEIVGTLSDRVHRRPPVQFLRAVIPVRNDIAHSTDENRVMGEIEQTSLLRSFRHFDFELSTTPLSPICISSFPS